MAISGKPKGSKQVAEWQSWEKSAQDKRFLVVGGTLALFTVVILIAVGFSIRSILVERRVTAQYRPTLVNSQPPALVQPYTCDSHTGLQSANNIQTFLKNIGNAGTADITATFVLQVVPEQHVGTAAFDEIPSGNCRERPRRSRRTYALAAGAETTPRLPQPAATLPPVLSGEAVQLYGVSCAFYSDNSRNDHAVCDTYRFRPASGTSVFICDGTAQAGKFDETPVVGCTN